MGRCNNKRTQAAAEATRHQPSRARFSKPPPRNKQKAKGGGGGRGGSGASGRDGGRDGGRGGRDGGRGGRGRGGASAATKAKVVNKIAKRGEKKNTSSISQQSNQLGNIDKSQLDELTLSEKTMDFIYKLLTDLNVVKAPGGNDNTVKTATSTIVSAVAAPFCPGNNDNTSHTDPRNYSGNDPMDTRDASDDADEKGVEGWDDDGVAANSMQVDSDDEDEDVIDEEMQRNAVFCHLTVQLSFYVRDAARAIRHAESITLAAAAAEEPNSNGKTATTAAAPKTEKSKKTVDRTQLANALDWLCLHLTEQQLKAGFMKNRDGLAKLANNKGAVSNGRGSSTIPTTRTHAIPHPSITVAKKLTEDTEWRKLARLEERVVGFLRLGFHSAEAMQACDTTDLEEGSANLFPEALQDSETLRLLLTTLEREVLGDGAVVEFSGTSEEEEAAAVEREMEQEALSAIYDDRFQVLDSGVQGRYKATIHPVDESEGSSPMVKSCELHIFIRRGYPGAQVPLFLLYNPNLPAPLLRKVNAAAMRKARENTGIPVIFETIKFIEASLASIRKDFVKEQRVNEFEEAQIRLRKEAGHTVDPSDIDVSSVKAGRRHKPRSDAASDENGVSQRAREERLLRQKDRVEPVKAKEKNIRYSKAERVVLQREKDRFDEELEQVGRSAMMSAFNSGKSTEDARAASMAAKKAYRQEHGLEDTPSDQTPKVIKPEKVAKVSSKKKNGSGAGAGALAVPTVDLADESESVEVGASSKPSQETATTVAFMDRLRGMYKDAEKGGTAGGAYALAESKHKASVDDEDVVAEGALPCPVAVPVGDLAKVMAEVVAVQNEQPWLVSDEARVPGAVSEVESLTPAQLKRRKDLSRALYDELKQKYGSKGSSNKSRPFQKMLAQRERLPAYKMRQDIVSTIARSQITVIAGDTGCGKTTQVPQLVLDDLILNNRGSEANIIVTQPRRISAIGVSERIASERCEKVGETCGYSIKLEKKMSRKTRLLLCTTGILLRRLQCDPDLASVSHVFVDEVHERDLNTDFLLIILKDLLMRRKSLKLVLMSATLNSDAFASFFSGCEIVSIPGRAHPVEEFRLEDILQKTGHEIQERSDYAFKAKHGSTDRLSKAALKKMYHSKGYSAEVIHSLSIVDETVVNYELLANLLEHIALSSDEGAVLVFMPGMMEITKAIEEMKRKEFFQSDQVIIHPLHSSLSTSEQTAVFKVPPSGVRKIVVATNIAETSITIEDVVYVVDAGRVKENRRDEVRETPALVECWVSRASAKQRRGRAGRVRPGIAYHMYSTHTHDAELKDYQLPEMLRVGLEDLALQVLILDLGEPSDFLARAMNPPSALSMRNSLNLLEELGAVECTWQKDTPVVGNNRKLEGKAETCAILNVTTELTALGFHLAMLPVEPRVGKMMIYGALFGCVEPALTIAASMSSRNPFVSPFDSRDAADEARQQFATEDSDHLTVLTAFNEWRELKRTQGEGAARSFLRDNFLSRMTLFQMEELRKQYSRLLVDIGFLPGGFQLAGRGRGKNQQVPTNTEANNANAGNVALVKAVLCAGLYPNIIVAPKQLVEGSKKQQAGDVAFQSRSKGEVYLHPSTISFASKRLSSRYCCFHEIVKTKKMYVRDCTTVSPFALVLFGGALTVYQVEGIATVDGWLKFRISAKPATLVKLLRAQMESMLLRKIIAPEDNVTDSPQAKALIESVSRVLQQGDGPDNVIASAPAFAPAPQRIDGAEMARPYNRRDDGYGRSESNSSSNGGGRGGGGRGANGRGDGDGRSNSNGGGRDGGGRGRGRGRSGGGGRGRGRGGRGNGSSGRGQRSN